MPAGIEIINSSGTVLIDENYANLALRRRGSATVALNGLGMRVPLVATRVTNGGSVGLIKVDANTTTGSGTAIFTGTPGTTFEWYIFALPAVTSNAGLQIFNASGTLVFDSGNQYARAVGDIWSGQGTSWYGQQRAIATNRQYAVGWLMPWHRVTSTSRAGDCSGAREQYKATKIAQVATQTASTITISNLTYSADTVWSECTTNDPRAYRSAFQLAVLDVTGY